MKTKIKELKAIVKREIIYYISNNDFTLEDLLNYKSKNEYSISAEECLLKLCLSFTKKERKKLGIK